MKRLPFTLITLLLLVVVQLHAQRTFVHPGGFVTNEDIANMKQHIEARENPWYSEWQALQSVNPSTYTAAPSAEIGGSEGTRQRVCKDAKVAFNCAVQWRVTGNEAFARCAAAILTAYGNTIQSASAQLFQYPSRDLVLAAEMLRNEDGTFYSGWTEANRTKFLDKVRTILYPPCRDQAFNHAMASWSAAASVAVLMMGILLDDATIYEEGLALFRSKSVAGSVYNVIVTDNGQVKEMARDNVHAMLGLGDLATMAKVAYSQGDDLFAEGNNRLLKGFDYWCCYNSGHEDLYYEPQGLWYYISTHDNGFRLRPDGTNFEVVYNHFKEIKKLDDSHYPYLTLFTKLARPEHNGENFWGTLYFSRSLTSSPVFTEKPAKPQHVRAEAALNYIWLTWQHPQGEDARGFKVYRSLDGQNWTNITTQDYYTDHNFRDNGVTPGVKYYYKVSFINRAGESELSEAVSAMPDAGTETLPTGWNYREIGTSPLGSGIYSPVQHGTFKLDGGCRGDDIWRSPDTHGFLYNQITGNATLTARVTTLGGPLYKVGLLMRETLTGDSKRIAIGFGETGFRYARMSIRPETGAGSWAINGDDFTYIPCWLRITREGSKFSAYQSRDGVNWIFVGSTTVSMGARIFAGMYVIARSSDTKGQVVFDHVTLTDNNRDVAAAPTEFKAEAMNSSRAVLSWTAAEGAESYIVTRSDSETGVYDILAEGLKGTSFTDSLLTTQKTYYYRIQSENISGLSADTAKTMVTMPARALPVIPQGVSTGQTGVTKASVRWLAVDEAGEYIVKRATSAEGEFEILGTASDLVYEDANVEAGGTYYYTVTAKNEVGESQASEVVSVNIIKVMKLRGTALGEGVASGSSYSNAFDNSLVTYFEGKNASGDWVGLDLGRDIRGRIAFVEFASRSGYTYRMLGGVFQAATKEDFSDAVTLGTIDYNFKNNTYTGLALNSDNHYRYLRYISPEGGYCSVAEIRFYGDTIKLKSQTITFNTLPNKTTNDLDFDPGAVASSGLPVRYTSSNENVATIVDNKIHIVGAGVTSIRASQEGDEEWGGALTRSSLLVVTLGDPSSVNDIASENAEPIEVEIYSVDGIARPELSHGINIVKEKMSDGTVRVRKVIIK